MDRYNDIKILLKTWEQSFVQEHQRKPNKGDIDGAPEETKKLYKEYRKFKQAKENSSNGHTDPTPTAQTPSSEKLNRKSMPVAAPKLTLTAKDRESLQASAQYFGMKLKSNLDLGALTKERPVSLKKSFTPRRTPLKSFKDGQSPDSHTLLSPLPKPANTRQDPLASPMQRGTEHPQQPPEEPFEPLTAFTPSKLWSPAAGASSSDRQAGSRAQQLRQTFTKRLTSVDSSWLERCQVFDEVVDAEKPVVGNLPLAMEAAVSSPYAKGGGTGKGENAGRAASSFVTPSRQNEGTTLLGERASKSTITQARPSPDEHQPHICCGVTSAADPASLWPAGQRSSLGSGSGGGEGEDGETRSGLKGQAEGGTTEETAIGATTAKKSRARARKGRGGRVVEEARVSTQPPQAEGDELGLEKKGTKKKGGKSKRDPDTDGENPEGTEKVEGAVKKRRRTKKEDIADGGSPKKAPRARKKAAKTDDGDVSDKEDGDVTEKEVVKQKPRVPQENLLGEVDEEDINAARNRGSNTMRPKATKNSDGNFVKINLKKKSHVKGYACRGAGLRKQLTMEKFQLKGERFGGPDSRFRGGFSRRGRGGFRGGFGGFNLAAAVDSAAADEASAVEEEPFELPTLEDVARATGTLCSERLGMSTLVVLSTGMGKSLCYQLPAYLYAQRSNSITLVVSPLVSLMDDQLSGLPSKLKAAAIHSNMSKKQREAAVEKVKAGEVHVLLLSPEALVGGGHSGSGCLPPADQLPPVAFACIDEAHCVSEWSHNFRPCYLRLCKGERFGSLESVIVYCTRRDETTRISALLRTCLQGVLLKESNRTASQEEDDNPRRRVQNNFMCGELRVVVATVAFGMGLDKSDVRGIVHYNMPKSFESYVQEIGRAGRDWLPAHCHLFLDPEGGDLHELRRHIYADTVDHYTVKKLVQKVFPPCKCRQIHQKQQDLAREEVDDSEMMELMDTCDETSAAAPEHTKETSQNTPVEQLEQAKVHTEDKDVPTLQPSEGEQKEPPESSVPLPQRGDGEQDVEEEVVPGGGDDWPTTRVCHTHERTIPIQDTVEALDITEEGLETLLCYLELHPQQWVELLHPTLSVCKMVCYNGPQQLRKLTKICPPVAVVLARKRMAGERVEACDSLDFDVVEFSNLSFYFRSYGDLTPDEMDRVCEFLHDRVVAQERTKLYQLKACFKAFRSVAYTSCRSCTDQLDERRSLKLKGLLGDYFDKRRDLDLSRKFQEEKDGEDEVLIKCKSFLGNHSDEKFSGRAVARIFHGIAQTFGRDRRYWRKYIQFDFNEIIRFAIQEIVRF
ncbi:unnamed protein product, partial [Coregonus sp. 'balchen']